MHTINYKWFYILFHLFPSCNCHDSRHLERTTTLIVNCSSSIALPQQKTIQALYPPCHALSKTNTTSAITMACNFGKRRAASAASPCPWQHESWFHPDAHVIQSWPCHPVLAWASQWSSATSCCLIWSVNIQQLLNIKGQGEWKPARPFNRKLLQLAGFVRWPFSSPTASKISPPSAWNSATQTPQTKVSKKHTKLLVQLRQALQRLQTRALGASLAKQHLWCLKPLVYHPVI